MSSNNLAQTPQEPGENLDTQIASMRDEMKKVIAGLTPLIQQGKERAIEQKLILKQLELLIDGRRIDYNTNWPLADMAEHWWYILSSRKMQETGVIEPPAQIGLARCFYELADGLRILAYAFENPTDRRFDNANEHWQRQIMWILNHILPILNQGLRY